MSILLGKGDGTFQPRVPYAVGAFPQVVAVSDFNGDGKLDLVSANHNSKNVSVLHGNGDGTFQTAVNYTVGSSPEAVAVGDLNGDGAPDLAVANLNDNNVEVLFNSGGVSVSPASLTFKVQVLNTKSAPQNVTLTNTGTGSVTINSIATSAQFGQTHTCGSTLAGGASCTISVTFTPTSAGKQTGTLTIVDSAGTQTVALTGTGTAVKLVPKSLNFGNVAVGGSSVKPVTLTNVGSTTLTISSITTSGPNGGEFSQNNSCGNTVFAHASCTINVIFKPQMTGTRSATLTVADSDPTKTQTVKLSGNGI